MSSLQRRITAMTRLIDQLQKLSLLRERVQKGDTVGQEAATESPAKANSELIPEDSDLASLRHFNFRSQWQRTTRHPVLTGVPNPKFARATKQGELRISFFEVRDTARHPSHWWPRLCSFRGRMRKGELGPCPWGSKGNESSIGDCRMFPKSDQPSLSPGRHGRNNR